MRESVRARRELREKDKSIVRGSLLFFYSFTQSCSESFNRRLNHVLEKGKHGSMTTGQTDEWQKGAQKRINDSKRHRGNGVGCPKVKLLFKENLTFLYFK